MFARLRDLARRTAGQFFELRLACLFLMLRIKTRARRALGLRRRNFHAYFVVRHFDAQGRLLWADLSHNMVHDQGEEFICQVVYSQVQSVPENYYVGLDNRGSLAEADTLASLSGEPSGNGYARVAVASDATDFTVSQEGGDWQAKTKLCNFTADGGSIGPVSKAFIATSIDGSGKLIQSNALSQSRTLSAGESLDVTMFCKMSE